jgi:hypothetical protein
MRLTEAEASSCGLKVYQDIFRICIAVPILKFPIKTLTSSMSEVYAGITREEVLYVLNKCVEYEYLVVDSFSLYRPFDSTEYSAIGAEPNYWNWDSEVVTGEVTVTVAGRGDPVVTTIEAGDIFSYNGIGSALMASTYVSQAYTIHTSDSSFNPVSQIASGSMPIDLNTISFGDYFESTYFGSVPGAVPINGYYFIVNASGIQFKLPYVVSEVVSGGGSGAGAGV